MNAEPRIRSFEEISADLLIGILIASQSRDRIIQALRAGIIDRDKADMLLRECRLERDPCSEMVLL